MNLKLKAQKKLADIEHRNRSWRSDVMRKISIMDEILENACGCSIPEQPLWYMIKELYDEKYPSL